jgi:Flp pilus assembly protein TadG
MRRRPPLLQDGLIGNPMRFVGARDGAIAVEFGLIAPVMLVMLLGLVEVSSAISTSLSVQGAARAGTHFGLTKPPVQGDLGPVIAATRAAMPADWSSGGSSSGAQVSASLVCECEVTGPIACGKACNANEKSLTYLKVDVSKAYTPIVKLHYFASNHTFKNSSQVRLQ